MHYYNQFVTATDLVFSVDNLVFETHIGAPKREDLMMLLTEISGKTANITNYHSSKPGTFIENFIMQMGDGSSFWLGVGLNLGTPDRGRIRMDFNPNKVAHHEATQRIFYFLCNASKPMHHKVVRFDLAIDIPAERSDCFLVKDNRAYSERRHGAEWTQYLGAKSSNHGRVKLYNKQVESNLPYALTRLELTLHGDTAYEAIPMPKVYYIKDRQVSLDELKLTDTDRFILGALIAGYGEITMLSRRTREKMENLLRNYVQQIFVSEENYDKILRQLHAYVATGELRKDEQEC